MFYMIVMYAFTVGFCPIDPAEPLTPYMSSVLKALIDLASLYTG